MIQFRTLAPLSMLLGAQIAVAQGAPQGGQGQQQAQQQPQQAPQQQQGAQQQQAQPSAGAPSGGPSALYGLKPSENPDTLTLEQVLQSIQDNSFDLKLAKERLIRQRLIVGQAWTAITPRVSVGGNYQYSFPEQEVEFFSAEQNAQQAQLFRALADITESTAALNPDPSAQQASLEQAAGLRTTANDLEFAKVDPIILQPAHQVNAQAQLTMPIFNGRTIPLVFNAYDAVELAEASTASLQETLLFSATQAYYGAITAKKFVKIAEQQVKNADDHLEDIKARVEVGSLQPLQLERAQLSKLQAEQSLRAARRGVDTTLANLGLLMDRDTQFDIADPSTEAKVPSGHVEELTSLALNERPEVRAQKLSLTIAERGTTDVWMQYMPSLNFSVNARYTTNTGGFVAIPITGAAVVSLNIPIFDGGSRIVAMREARSKVREAELQLAQTRRKIEAQVRGNLQEVEAKKADLEIAEKSLNLARSSANNAKEYFKLGAANSLTVIDANLAEFSAEVSYARAELDLELARLGLAFVLGQSLTGE